MPDMRFVVEFFPEEEPGRVEIRWNVTLGSKKSEVHWELYDLLSGLHGVEDAELRRYSATLRVANHVVNTPEEWGQLATGLAEALRDENLVYVLKQHGFALREVVAH